MTPIIPLLLALAIAALLAACATAPESPGAGATTADAATGTPASPAAPSPAVPPSPSPLDLYKQGAARHLVAKNKPRTFDTVPHHFLRSIVVLRIVVDARGVVRTVWVERGNGYVKLEQVAMKAVRDSSPLPAPPPELMRTGALEYSETFLFRNDNKFQVRSIALEQPDPNDRAGAAATTVHAATKRSVKR